MEKEELQNKEQTENPKDINPEEIKDEQEKDLEKSEEKKDLSPEEELINLKDKLARTFAEMENQRRRFEKEK